jgi:hypothetical protein
MHTKFAATVALTALLTGGGATLAMAQPTTVVPALADCRAPAPNESGYGSRKLSLQECQQAAIPPAGNSAAPTYTPSNAGLSAHHHPHGHRYP